MFLTTGRGRATYAALAAIGWTLLSPLLALAYFGLGDGAEMLSQRSVSAWARPARDHLGALLTWASPERVYSSYLQALALLFPAVLLSALTARVDRRSQAGRFERWGWRIATTGYGLLTVGLVVAAVFLSVGDPNGDALNGVFLAVFVPGTLASAIGSTLLGVAFLRRGRSGLPAWLLALAAPFQLLGTGVLGHNSLGILPVVVAWAITTWRARDAATVELERGRWAVESTRAAT